MKVEVALLNRAKLLKGKALFQSYQKQQLHFMRERQSIPEREVQYCMKHIYDKAKEAILLLGYALDYRFLDEEGSKFLDLAMMDYMRETNQLIDCRRCLLCRERRERSDMRKSHFIPKSVLKKLGKVVASEGEHKFLLPLGGRISLQSPGECTFWMLCKICEQRLSQNGEAAFIKGFFSKVCGDQGPNSGSAVIPYDSWLYEFCLGIIFRGLATERFAAFLNADEVYHVFLACREYLKDLPVKLDSAQSSGAVNVNGQSKAKDSQEESVLCKPLKQLEVSLLINPTTLKENEHVKLELLATILQTMGTPFLSTIRLYDGKRAPSLTAHFFAAHFGNCNIITKFQPSVQTELPPWSIVNPAGGHYTLYDESQRWGHFPPGFWTAEVAGTLRFAQVVLDFFTRTPSQLSTHEQHPVSISSVESKKPENLLEVSDVFPSEAKVNHVIFSDFCRAPLFVNYLPKGYRVITSANGFVHTIQLPPNHQYVLHATVTQNEGKWATICLITNQNNKSTYLIGVFCRKSWQIIDWVFTNDGKEQANLNPGSCLEASFSNKRESQRKILELLPQVLKSKGFYNFSSFTQQLSCR